jgi:hypothetical protein
MATREDGNVTFQRPEPSNQPVYAFGNLGGQFAAWTYVAKTFQSGRALRISAARLSLVLAVVPLREVRFDFRKLGMPVTSLRPTASFGFPACLRHACGCNPYVR